MLCYSSPWQEHFYMVLINLASVSAWPLKSWGSGENDKTKAAHKKHAQDDSSMKRAGILPIGKKILSLIFSLNFLQTLNRRKCLGNWLHQEALLGSCRLGKLFNSKAIHNSYLCEITLLSSRPYLNIYSWEISFSL